MIDKDKVLQLLGNGLSAEIVATAVGCDPSYISQLLSDTNFRDQVSELRLKNLTADSARDQKYGELEDRLITKLQETLDYIVKPREVLTALATVNNMKRRGAPVQESTIVNNKIVNLSIPAQATINFQFNDNRQVIAINTGDNKEQSLLTIPSTKLTAMATQQALPSQEVKSDENSRSPQNCFRLPERGRRAVQEVSSSDSEELLLKELGG